MAYNGAREQRSRRERKRCVLTLARRRLPLFPQLCAVAQRLRWHNKGEARAPLWRVYERSASRCAIAPQRLHKPRVGAHFVYY